MWGHNDAIKWQWSFFFLARRYRECMLLVVVLSRLWPLQGASYKFAKTKRKIIYIGSGWMVYRMFVCTILSVRRKPSHDLRDPNGLWHNLYWLRHIRYQANGNCKPQTTPQNAWHALTIPHKCLLGLLLLILLLPFILLIALRVEKITWLICEWPVKLLFLLTGHSFSHLCAVSLRCQISSRHPSVMPTHKQAKHPMLRPWPSQYNLSSCRLTPMCWHPAATEHWPVCFLMVKNESCHVVIV